MMFSSPADKNDLGLCQISVLIIRAPVSSTDKSGELEVRSVFFLFHSGAEFAGIELQRDAHS